MRILFVCTGNTCRSPMAEEVARILAKTFGLEDFEAESAGLYTDLGLAASLGAQAAISLIGGDLSGHNSMKISQDSIEVADLILCMTQAHLSELLNRFPDAEDKLFTLTEYANEIGEKEIFSGDIADPFGGDQEEYTQCLTQIAAAIRIILENIAKEDSNSKQQIKYHKSYED